MGFLAAPLIGGLTVGGAIATGAAVVGTALQIKSQRDQAKAAEARARYQAEVAKRNAAVEEENRQRAIAEAAVEAQDQDFDARRELGALMAEQGALGLDLGSGSFLRQRAGLETIAATDRARIIDRGQNEADAAKRRADNFREEAGNATAAAADARRSGRRAVAASLISGIGSVASKTAARITGTSSSTQTRGNSLTTSLRPRARPIVA